MSYPQQPQSGYPQQAPMGQQDPNAQSPQMGYQQGMQQPGYPQQGYPQGYPQQGYPQQGYGMPAPKKFSPIDLGIVGVGALGALLALIGSFLSWLHISYESLSMSGKGETMTVSVSGFGKCSSKVDAACKGNTWENFPANGVALLLFALIVAGGFAAYLLVKQGNAKLAALLGVLLIATIGIALTASPMGMAGSLGSDSSDTKVSTPGATMALIGMSLAWVGAAVGLWLSATRKAVQQAF